MQRRMYRSSSVLALVAGAVLSAAVFAADTPTGNGVTFANGSNHGITLYTRYGSDASCEGKPKAQTVRVDPERRICPSGWGEVKADGTRHFQ